VIPFCDLSRAAALEAERLRDAFERVRGRGRFILGAEVEAFESEFASFVGAAHGVGCANGTDALTLALLALGIGPGDEVLTVSMTCAPTATGILRSGATPVFVDVDDETLTMSPAALDDALSARTRAVVPVHLYGRPADMGPIAAFASKNRLALVEDCAQAHGARYAGRSVGTFGHAASWSFYPTKNLGALGDGGMVTTADPAVAARLARLRVYGYATRNDATEPGLNSRLDELQAALLRERLTGLPSGNERRARLAARYDERLRDVVRTPPSPRPGDVPANHLYVIRLSNRDRVRQGLSERGVGTDIHYPRGVHQQLAFASFPRREIPVTEKAVTEILSLPLYPELSDAELETVCLELRAEGAR